MSIIIIALDNTNQHRMGTFARGQYQLGWPPVEVECVATTQEATITHVEFINARIVQCSPYKQNKDNWSGLMVREMRVLCSYTYHQKNPAKNTPTLCFQVLNYVLMRTQTRLYYIIMTHLSNTATDRQSSAVRFKHVIKTHWGRDRLPEMTKNIHLRFSGCMSAHCLLTV